MMQNGFSANTFANVFITKNVEALENVAGIKKTIFYIYS